ncbi:P-loop containing nucleoside triphosphate hydrolase domain-containing protein [Rozella allomycis CSF55]|uniref:p-loop containing nucleoside triphosphate hydrolase domain-containing protein n=2 Tax=Rozella allomycis (strain CSF55) TaxID=988480 RepID=A0A075B1V3_ROZAC|nr:P-loop containing nucleoside triphosphate hydrolase domain-containing protein [Rozella allomycis CSF55]|eukprot:EPZ36345.1 P-loop containing nucleoside triphosphate hydrolase domain-containing protein [Rozella allomycis CSF55]
MGIRGLHSYLHANRREYSQLISLTKQPRSLILVDGSSVIFYLWHLQYSQLPLQGVGWSFGCDYRHFVVNCEWFFGLLEEHAVVVVFDGASEDVKRETVVKRGRERRDDFEGFLKRELKETGGEGAEEMVDDEIGKVEESVEEVNVGEEEMRDVEELLKIEIPEMKCERTFIEKEDATFVPFMANRLLYYVCKRLNIKTVFAFNEADSYISSLYKTIERDKFCNVFCMGEDSDYYCMGVKYIPLSSLRFEDFELKGRLFDSKTIIDKFGFSSLEELKLFGCLVGNDYVKDSDLEAFYLMLTLKRHLSRREKIELVICFLKWQKTTDLSVLFRDVERRERKKLTRLIQQAMEVNEKEAKEIVGNVRWNFGLFFNGRNRLPEIPFVKFSEFDWNYFREIRSHVYAILNLERVDEGRQIVEAKFCNVLIEDELFDSSDPLMWKVARFLKCFNLRFPKYFGNVLVSSYLIYQGNFNKVKESKVKEKVKEKNELLAFIELGLYHYLMYYECLNFRNNKEENESLVDDLMNFDESIFIEMSLNYSGNLQDERVRRFLSEMNLIDIQIINFEDGRVKNFENIEDDKVEQTKADGFLFPIEHLKFRNEKRNKADKREFNKRNSVEAEKEKKRLIAVSKGYNVDKIEINAGGEIPRYPGEYSKKRRKFEYDEFQKRAFASLYRERSVLVSAPTSNGKTEIGMYAVEKGLIEGKRVVYVCPTKALVHQAYCELTSRFNLKECKGCKEGLNKKINDNIINDNKMNDNRMSDNKMSGNNSNPLVGILTNDLKIDLQARILVTVPEIVLKFYENGRGDEFEVVVVDEIHLIQDEERGIVWEKMILMIPSGVLFVGLSATLGTSEELFFGWLKSIFEMKNDVIDFIKTDKRVIPLNFYSYCGGLIKMEKVESGDGVFEKVFRGEVSLIEIESDVENKDECDGNVKSREKCSLHLNDFYAIEGISDVNNTRDVRDTNDSNVKSFNNFKSIPFLNSLISLNSLSALNECVDCSFEFVKGLILRGKLAFSFPIVKKVIKRKRMIESPVPFVYYVNSFVDFFEFHPDLFVLNDSKDKLFLKCLYEEFTGKKFESVDTSSKKDKIVEFIYLNLKNKNCFEIYKELEIELCFCGIFSFDEFWNCFFFLFNFENNLIEFNLAKNILFCHLKSLIKSSSFTSKLEEIPINLLKEFKALEDVENGKDTVSCKEDSTCKDTYNDTCHSTTTSTSTTATSTTTSPPTTSPPTTTSLTNYFKKYPSTLEQFKIIFKNKLIDKIPFLNVLESNLRNANDFLNLINFCLENHIFYLIEEYLNFNLNEIQLNVLKRVENLLSNKKGDNKNDKIKRFIQRLTIKSFKDCYLSTNLTNLMASGNEARGDEIDARGNQVDERGNEVNTCSGTLSNNPTTSTSTSNSYPSTYKFVELFNKLNVLDLYRISHVCNEKYLLNEDEIKRLKLINENALNLFLFFQSKRELNEIQTFLHYFRNLTFNKMIENGLLNSILIDLDLNKKLPVIIFENSRNGCEQVAFELFKYSLPKINSDKKKLIDKTIKMLKSIEPQLEQSGHLSLLARGIGIHHSGLSIVFRLEIENLSRKASSVLFLRDSHFFPLNDMMFNQMAGRAGRRGFDISDFIDKVKDREVKGREVKDKDKEVNREVKGDKEVNDDEKDRLPLPSLPSSSLCYPNIAQHGLFSFLNGKEQ